ncbi:hypothetical protein C8J56DRAFT_168 [Mycena floridula]|nr:hypothetical protein C8J56DRAFT_168 [Mycena floridula]
MVFSFGSRAWLTSRATIQGPRKLPWFDLSLNLRMSCIPADGPEKELCYETIYGPSMVLNVICLTTQFGHRRLYRFSIESEMSHYDWLRTRELLSVLLDFRSLIFRSGETWCGWSMTGYPLTDSWSASFIAQKWNLQSNSEPPKAMNSTNSLQRAPFCPETLFQAGRDRNHGVPRDRSYSLSMARAQMVEPHPLSVSNIDRREPTSGSNVSAFSFRPGAATPRSGEWE